MDPSHSTAAAGISNCDNGVSTSASALPQVPLSVCLLVRAKTHGWLHQPSSITWCVAVPNPRHGGQRRTSLIHGCPIAATPSLAYQRHCLRRPCLTITTATHTPRHPPPTTVRNHPTLPTTTEQPTTTRQPTATQHSQHAGLTWRASAAALHLLTFPHAAQQAGQQSPHPPMWSGGDPIFQTLPHQFHAQSFQYSERGTANPSLPSHLHAQPADVERMEPVHVLLHANGPEDLLLVQMLGQLRETRGHGGHRLGVQGLTLCGSTLLRIGLDSPH